MSEGNIETLSEEKRGLFFPRLECLFFGRGHGICVRTGLSLSRTAEAGPHTLLYPSFDRLPELFPELLLLFYHPPVEPGLRIIEPLLLRVALLLCHVVPMFAELAAELGDLLKLGAFRVGKREVRHPRCLRNVDHNRIRFGRRGRGRRSRGRRGGSDRSRVR